MNYLFRYAPACTFGISRVCWVVAFLVAVASLGPATAATTDWQDMGGGQARIAASLDPQSGKLFGVIDLKLNKGWKTYWRQPGESGIPPRFDFSGSNGFTVQNIRFPTPEYLEVSETRFAGYRERVQFLFEGTLDERPGTQLTLKLLVGLCETICIPAQAEFSLDGAQLRSSDATTARLLTMAKFNLPAIGEPTDIQVSQIGDSVMRVVRYTDKPHAQSVLYVEAPNGWYFHPTHPTSVSSNQEIFEFDVSRLPADANPETAHLRLTYVNGNKGIEYFLH